MSDDLGFGMLKQLLLGILVIAILITGIFFLGYYTAYNKAYRDAKKDIQQEYFEKNYKGELKL